MLALLSHVLCAAAVFLTDTVATPLPEESTRVLASPPLRIPAQGTWDRLPESDFSPLTAARPEKTPKLLRTLTGGSFFGVADTDLDGHVEIWTEDTAAVKGFDNLTLAELDFAPPMVLRFEKGKLLDVSSEFVPDFDKRIEALRSQLRPEVLCRLSSPPSGLC